MDWTPPTATDNAGTPALASAINPGHVFSIGTTAVTYICVDAYNNGATCIFNVTVLGKTKLFLSSIYSRQVT